MNVSLMLLILVAYIQDWGLLYTLRNQCLDQLRHLVFQVFVLICVGITIHSPLEMCPASKGSALGLLAVCLYQFKNKHLSELQRWFQNIEKLTTFFVPQMQTMGDKSVETLCHIGVLKVNFSPHLYNTTPSPLPNVGFQVSRICLFPLQH